MNKKESGKLQLIGSSFVIITGLFVIISIGNSITGSVVGNRQIEKLELLIFFWGILTLIAGIWMIRKKDFYKSIFD